jgi:hypothetical protein
MRRLNDDALFVLLGLALLLAFALGLFLGAKVERGVLLTAEIAEAKGGGIMIRKANYVIVRTTPDLIVIRDVGPWDRHPSVTNDAENVVEELAAKGYLPAGRRLLYHASEGQLDELLVKDGRFVGFAPGPAGEGGGA